jgi:hypothetical protein
MMAGNGLTSIGSEAVMFPGDQQDSAEAVQFIVGKTINDSPDYSGLAITRVSTGSSPDMATAHHLIFIGNGHTEDTTLRSQRAMAKADRILGALESPFRLS